MGAPQGFLMVPVGLNPDGDLRTLELDADDALKIAFSEAAKGLVGGHGWISSAWQKNPILFGVSGAVSRAWSDTTLAAGANTVSDSAVPAGEIWIITNCTIRYLGTLPTYLEFGGYVAAVFSTFWRETNLIANELYSQGGWWVLEEGDYLYGYTPDATLNDDLYMTAQGFRIDVDQ